MFVRDHIRVIEADDGGDCALFDGTTGEGSMPILKWATTHGGWQLYYLNVYGEVQHYRVVGARHDIELPVQQAREYLNGPHSLILQTE
jgi:hypothetical protein